MTSKDYSTFGVVMKARDFSTSKYRYKFNGKEADEETETENYGMRWYDGDLGIFLSVDPIIKDFPMLSPYQYASNDPIMNIDLDGLEGQNYLGLPESSTFYGDQGHDYGFVGGEALEIGKPENLPKAQAGEPLEGMKYYWCPTCWTDYGKGSYMWQKKVMVTTYKTVEKTIEKTITETIPAKPPKKITEHKSTSYIWYSNDPKSTGTKAPDDMMIKDAPKIVGYRADIAKKAKGKITSIDIIAQRDDKLTSGIVAELEKAYDTKVNVSYDPKQFVEYQMKVNYDVTKLVGGSPEKTVTKIVKQKVTEKVAVTEVKQ